MSAQQTDKDKKSQAARERMIVFPLSVMLAGTAGWENGCDPPVTECAIEKGLGSSILEQPNSGLE